MLDRKYFSEPGLAGRSLTSLGNCTILVSILDPTSISDKCPDDTFSHLKEISNCSDAKNNSVKCVNETLTLGQCSDVSSSTICCNDSIVKILLNCFNEIEPTTVLPPITTTTPVNNNSSEYEPLKNTPVQSSIITSNMFLYFVIKRSTTVSVEEIIAALKNFKPSISLFAVCGTSSSHRSSFNSTLSKVEQLIQVKLDAKVSASQLGIPSPTCLFEGYFDSSKWNFDAHRMLKSIGRSDIFRWVEGSDRPFFKSFSSFI